MQMEPLLEQLLDLLRQETGLYRSLLSVIDMEKEAAIRSGLEALNAARFEKEKILAELHKSDRRRQWLVADLAEKLGCAAQGLTLRAIANRVDEPFAGRLRQAGRDFSAVLSQLQAANQRNRQLIDHSLALLRGSFNLLNELTASDPVYYRTGNIQSVNATGKCVRSKI
jgi:flagellar biosynthesis/type III secretory pathway chaperone